MSNTENEEMPFSPTPLYYYLAAQMKTPSERWTRLLELRLAGMPLARLKEMAISPEEQQLLSLVEDAEKVIGETYLAASAVRDLYELSSDQVHVDINRGRYEPSEYFKKGRTLYVSRDAANRLYADRNSSKTDRRYKRAHSRPKE